MTVALNIRFDLGRYHATPWGRNVNEGAVEFPPSPWRLLRALYAVWKLFCAELSDGDVHGLLTALAAVPPRYLVPPHTIAHTRHYYPDSTSRSGAPSTDRTLDAFAAVDPKDPLYVLWDLDLPAPQQEALRRLVTRLPYLGRADSVCTAMLVAETPVPGPGYATWAPVVDDAGSDAPGPPAAALLTADGPLDLDSLVRRPIDWRATKLLYPRGTTQLAYTEASSPAAPRRHRAPQDGPTVVRLKLAGPVRPPHTAAVAVADVLHRACTQRLDELRDGGPRRRSHLVGKEADGTALTNHQHAHFLMVKDRDQRIGEIVIWTPAGLGDDDFAAVAAVTYLKDNSAYPGFKGTIPLLLNAYGDPSLLPETWTRPASQWQSATPYLPTGHPKGDPLEFAAKRLRRDLHNLAPDLAERLTAITHLDGDPRRYDRRRAADRAGRRPVPPAHNLLLTFDGPVRAPADGPLALGRLSHYGLGHFTPVTTIGCR